MLTHYLLNVHKKKSSADITSTELAFYNYFIIAR